jgi:polysaccharide pyruvyl transferase CsaB
MKSPQARVVICGYYGFGNAGDELILAGMLRELRALRPGLTATVISGNPPATQASHGVDAVHWQDVPAIAAHVRAADLVLVGGGGLFQEYSGIDPDSLFTDRHYAITFYAEPAILGALCGRPVMLYAIGVGPLTSEHGRRTVRAACDAAQVITLRDEESARIVASLGVDPARLRVTADPAFALPVADGASAPAGLVEASPGGPGLLVGVSLRHWDVGVASYFWEHELAAGFDAFMATHEARLLFVPFQHSSRTSENDTAVAERVRSLLRDPDRAAVLSGECDPAELGAILGRCDLVVGMRLHAVILAAVSGVPSVALAYDPKVDQAMRQVGAEQFVVPLPDIEARAVALRMGQALAENKARRKDRGERVVRLAELARSNAAAAIDLLDRGSVTRELSPALSEVVARTVTSRFEVEAALRDEVAALRGAKGQAETALEARAEQLRRVQQDLARQSGEMQQVRADLAAKTGELDQARNELTRRGEELERSRSEAAQLRDRVSSATNELFRIHRSRLWWLASRYWRFLEMIGRLPGRGRTPSMAMPLPAHRPKAARARTAGAAPASESEDETVSQPFVAAATLAAKHDVVCLPIIDWGFRWQRPQQIASRFAAAGHRVFYVAQNFRADGPACTVEEKRPNVFEVSLRGPQRNVYQDEMNQEALAALFSSLDALRRDFQLGATAVIVELPFWWPLAKRARDAFAWPVTYDCMDYHAGFSTNRPEMIVQEDELLVGADLVVVSSALLEEQARRHNPNVALVRNGCEFEHFAAAATKISNPRPVVGYYGAIADWFDADLVADLAERRGDWDFVLVGSTFTADTSRLGKLANVSLPGEKPYAEIPSWLARFDVAIMPFKRIPLTEATNPVKAYEMLASGKPLVAVPIPEVAAMAPHVRLASTVEEFESEIAAALAERGAAVAAKRQAFARENTWEERFVHFEAIVAESFPLASVVVVTYQNVDLTRACLESIYERTEWPRFEVIVVDNASSDGTRRYLKDAPARFPNLAVVLNEKNWGFAAGNNIGLRQARGDYLVLLNNDTVVTRGWLSTLIRHLHADPKLGLIGPVTNEVGNEAKVEIGYSSPEDMPAWAATFVRKNDGLTRPIPMLAMFCLAMRRDVFERVGELDERFGIGMFEDDDYCRRVREAGLELKCADDCFVHHAGRASFKLLGDKRYLEVFEHNRALYQEKWGEMWQPHLDDIDRRRIPGLRRRLAEIVAEAGVPPERVVVFLPSIGWNTPLVQRPQQLARALARCGHLVVFDCSGSLIDDFADFVPVERNLVLYKGPRDVLETLDRPILWALPYNAPLTDRWERRRVVYDWIDDLSVFPYHGDKLAKNHQRMLAEADLVLCVARPLLEQATKTRRDALYLPNGVEYEAFARPPGRTALDARFLKLAGNGRPTVGYYGAIASWLDVTMLAAVAGQRPDWNFILIGKRLSGAPPLDSFASLPNALVLDAQPYAALPDYLARFTVAMIPFVLNTITRATSPIKMYEYFAAGKPVIAPPMPECEAFSEVHVVRDANEFSAALDATRAEAVDPAFVERLRAIGRENSWAKRVDVVAKRLAMAPPNE